MPGIGTIVNVIAIVAGGIIGITIGNFFTKRYQDTLMTSCGIVVIFMGFGSTMAQMLQVSNHQLNAQGTMMMIGCIMIGSLLGEYWNLENKFEQLGIWLKQKTGNQNDSEFVNAFVTCSLTICIGAMAIVGSIQDGILHDPSTLYAKAILDLIIVVIMTASMGKGAAFAAIPVGLLQGSITILSSLIQPIMTAAALANISYVGNILIACVGINLLWPKKIKVANMLPALLIAIIWAFLPI